MPPTAYRLATGESGDQNSHSLNYVIPDCNDRDAAIAAVAAAAPATLDLMPLDNIEVEASYTTTTTDVGLWFGTASYDRRSAPETGDVEYSFDISVGTQRIVQSISTVNTYGTESIDFGGAIAVDADGKPQGVDIRAPVSTFSYSFYKATVDGTYQRTVQAAVGKVNADTWQGYAPGELLLTGCTGQARKSEGDWQLSFKFEYRANETGLTVGGVTSVDIDGHDLMWVYYKEDTEAGRYIQKPKQINVERVYERVNFSTLGF